MNATTKVEQVYPFLAKCLPEKVTVRQLNFVTEEMVTEKFLGLKPQTNSWSGSLVSSSYRQIVSFVYADGTVEFDAVASEECHGSNYAHSKTAFAEGQTVLDALRSKGAVVENIKFIVLYDKKYNNSSGWSPVNQRDVNVFLPPTGCEYHELVLDEDGFMKSIPPLPPDWREAIFKRMREG